MIDAHARAATPRAPTRYEPLLRAAGVFHGTDGLLLQAVELELHRTEIVGLRGASGAGKTLLLALLVLLVPGFLAAGADDTAFAALVTPFFFFDFEIFADGFRHAPNPFLFVQIGAVSLLAVLVHIPARLVQTRRDIRLRAALRAAYATSPEAV